MSWLLAAPWILVLLLVACSYLTRRPLLRDYQPLGPGPLVSVVIPARNEARNIEPCVRSVLATAYASLEVIVVDDRSTDGTAEIVAPMTGGRLRLVRGTEPPPGWFGKQWAIVQGYRVATGELLLFTDADTRHTPEVLPRSVRALQVERVDLFSVLPRQEMRTFWERLIQPQVFFALGARAAGNIAHINRTRVDWNAIANGQFILTTRAAYENIGTHEAVKHTIVDDLALAQAYVRAGRDIFLAHAPEFMTTRMYGSLREIIAGWTKNLALGAPLMMPPVRAIRALLPYVMWLPALAWIAPPVVWLMTGSSGFAAIATLASVLTWIIIYAMERAPVWYALLYPLGAVMVGVIMIRSAVRGSRIVEWRGRVYRNQTS
jgi:chlorobactene glucosyltransferase